jgi:hypothetical protein
MTDEDFPGGKITIKRRLDGAVRIEFGREVILVSPANAVAIAGALLKEAGAQMKVVRAG